MSCHVVWCGGHVIWCDVIACCVMSRDAMRCHVMCAHVMSCYLLCPAMGWNVMSLRCHWLWGYVVWFEVVLWRCGDPKYYSVLLCTTKYYSSTTLYYKVLLQYYSVLQSTTTYYSSITLYSDFNVSLVKMQLYYYTGNHIHILLLPQVSMNEILPWCSGCTGGPRACSTGQRISTYNINI